MCTGNTESGPRFISTTSLQQLSLDQVACIVQRRDRVKFWSQLSSDALDLRALSILVIWRQRISIRDVIIATVTGTTISYAPVYVLQYVTGAI
jgi:hypothetical protein